MKNNKIKISIGIVSFHNETDIISAVESIEKYTERRISKRIYIIDNADGEHDYSVLVNKYPDVRYIKTHDNLGFGKGHNYIINEIDSEYHAIVNPDIVLHEDSFQKLIEFMDENTDVGMCIPKLIDEEGNFLYVYRREITFWDMFVRFFGRYIFKKRYRYHAMYDQDYSKPFVVPFAQGSFLVIRSELFKKIGGFDDRYFMYLEDADLCKKVNNESKVLFFPGTTVTHKWEKDPIKIISCLEYI